MKERKSSRVAYNYDMHKLVKQIFRWEVVVILGIGNE